MQVEYLDAINHTESNEREIQSGWRAIYIGGSASNVYHRGNSPSAVDDD